MRPLQLSEIARWCAGHLRGGDRGITAVDTDSRTVRAGALFVALRGERHDGHDHAAAAIAAGATAVLAEHALDLEVPQVVCADSQRALGDLARGLAAARATRVVAVTGSNGKTTVKTLAHAILARGFAAYANPGNRNNEIGLPLALIEQPEDAQVAVYEMGAGKPGDIAYLAGIAGPQVALVNNVGPAHLERMGTLLTVARTKGAIYDALPVDGVAVVNADDAFGGWFAQAAAPRRVLRFGVDSSAQVTARPVRCGHEGCRFVLVAPEGEAELVLALPGRHNVLNALAAAALALAAGAQLQDVAAGLAAAPSVAGRLVRHRLAGGAVLIDDSYNANPASVGVAIAALAMAGGNTVLVLGDMAELGAGALRLHAEVGERARAAGIGNLFTVGPLSAAASRAFGAGAQHFESQDALLGALRAALSPGTTCLVKGSRSSAMDRIVRALAGGADGEVGHAA
ncbi:MAG TPA: UDP-N-acetylmuramoyl-tripeptide--D-alanyl-D-alanine ligase [Xanthomonadaceae bacterium]|nr:UDP-N-acetylmuramoyl-tripeptide--D-alanyl-D-alanine ligase [Xanthomonadaceae bacterium]